jgi:hypothetical protein
VLGECRFRLYCLKCIVDRHEDAFLSICPLDVSGIANLTLRGVLNVVAGGFAYPSGAGGIVWDEKHPCWCEFCFELSGLCFGSDVRNLLDMARAMAMSAVELLRNVTSFGLVLEGFERTVIVVGEQEKKGYDVKGHILVVCDLVC